MRTDYEANCLRIENGDLVVGKYYRITQVGEDNPFICKVIDYEYDEHPTSQNTPYLCYTVAIPYSDGSSLDIITIDYLYENSMITDIAAISEAEYKEAKRKVVMENIQIMLEMLMAEEE